MPTLEVTDDFSIHDYRQGLKLLRQDDTTLTLENREGYTCPVCGEPFDRVLVARNGELSFPTAPPDPICVRTAGDELLVLTH